MILQAFKNHFLKSRVIALSYHIEPTMIQLSKAYLENPDESYLINDAKKYYEVKFYSQIAQNFKINPKYFSEGELKKYEETLVEMQKFNEFHDLINQLHDFYWECKALYIDISRDMTTSNLWGRSEFTTVNYEESLKGALNKFYTLLDQTKDYPDWQEKIKSEIGSQLHMIYTSIGTGNEFQDFFKDFDKPYYFK